MTDKRRRRPEGRRFSSGLGVGLSRNRTAEAEEPGEPVGAVGQPADEDGEAENTEPITANSQQEIGDDFAQSDGRGPEEAEARGFRVPFFPRLQFMEPAGEGEVPAEQDDDGHHPEPDGDGAYLEAGGFHAEVLRGDLDGPVVQRHHLEGRVGTRQATEEATEESCPQMPVGAAHPVAQKPADGQQRERGHGDNEPDALQPLEGHMVLVRTAAGDGELPGDPGGPADVGGPEGSRVLDNGLPVGAQDDRERECGDHSEIEQGCDEDRRGPQLRQAARARMGENQGGHGDYLCETGWGDWR